MFEFTKLYLMVALLFLSVKCFDFVFRPLFWRFLIELAYTLTLNVALVLIKLHIKIAKNKSISECVKSKLREKCWVVILKDQSRTAVKLSYLP
jgi:hypothetical protein